MTNHAEVERLRAAVLDVAASHPTEAPTVARICAAAGISRSDFYDLASSPWQLLSEALGDELLSAYEELPPPITPHEQARMALEHIALRIEIYRGPSRIHLMSMLRQTLAPAFQAINEELIRSRQTLPFGLSVDDDEAVAFIAAYVAGGGMSAIERWIETAEPDVEKGILLLRASAPVFWFE